MMKKGPVCRASKHRKFEDLNFMPILNGCHAIWHFAIKQIILPFERGEYEMNVLNAYIICFMNLVIVENIFIECFCFSFVF